VIFLDADDLLLPGALAARSGLLREEGVAWAHTEGFVEDLDGERHSFSAAYPAEDNERDGRIFPVLLCRNFITTSGAIVRREALEQVGGFDETIRFMEDWDLWLRLAVRFPVAYVPEPTFIQRRRPQSLSSNRQAMVYSRFQVLVKMSRLFRREVARAGPAARRSVADAHNALGYARAKQGQWRDARPNLWESVRLWPWQRRAWFLLLRSLIA
jgi:GT2 family glycosyltransferase